MLKEYVLKYSGKWLSLNEVYSKNRFLNSEKKRKYKEIFKELIKENKIERFDEFEVELTYNSRIDIENNSAGLKILVDTLRELELVPNDDKRFWKKLTIIPDTTLKHNTYIIKLITTITSK